MTEKSGGQKSHLQGIRGALNIFLLKAITALPPSGDQYEINR
jgi:hypothetical protein